MKITEHEAQHGLRGIIPLLVLGMILLGVLSIPGDTDALSDPYPISGTVFDASYNGTDPTNHTVSGATVTILNVATGDSTSTTSDINGSYSGDIANIGDYLTGQIIKVSASNTTTSGTATTILGTPPAIVNVTMGSGVSGIRFYTYAQDTGHRLQNVLVTIYNSRGSRVITMNTGTYGLVDYDLTPGNYSLEAKDTNGTYELTKMDFWITDSATTQTIAIPMVDGVIDDVATGVPDSMLWLIFVLLLVLAVIMLAKPSKKMDSKGEGSIAHNMVGFMAISVIVVAALTAGCVGWDDNPLNVTNRDIDKPYMESLLYRGFTTQWTLRLTQDVHDCIKDVNTYRGYYDLDVEWIRYDHSDVKVDSTFDDEVPDANPVKTTTYATSVGDKGNTNNTAYSVNNVWRDNVVLSNSLSLPFYGDPKDVVKAWFEQQVTNLWVDIQSRLLLIWVDVPFEIVIANPLSGNIMKSYVMNLYLPFHIARPDKVYNDYGGSREISHTIDLNLFTPFVQALGQIITIRPLNSNTKGYAEYSDDVSYRSTAIESEYLASVGTLCYGATAGYNNIGRTKTYVVTSGDAYFDYGFGTRYHSSDKNFPFESNLDEHSVNKYHAEV